MRSAGSSTSCRNYQLAALSAAGAPGRRKNRPVVVRFMKAMAADHALDPSEQRCRGGFSGQRNERSNPSMRGAAGSFTRSAALWHPDGDINLEGLQNVTQIYSEQTQAKGPVPNAAKYVDQSYLREALKEMGTR